MIRKRCGSIGTLKLFVPNKSDLPESPLVRSWATLNPGSQRDGFLASKIAFGNAWSVEGQRFDGTRGQIACTAYGHITNNLLFLVFVTLLREFAQIVHLITKTCQHLAGLSLN